MVRPRLNPSSAEVRFGKLEVSFGTYRGLRTGNGDPEVRDHFLFADDTLGMWWAPTVAVRAALLFLGELWRRGVQR
jgi:hypothetical protein